MSRESAVAGLAVDDIAEVWRVPRSAVYRYAHRYRWRRYTHTGRAYYHPDDVTATFEQLAREEPR